MELTDSQLAVVNHGYDPRTVLSVQAGPGTGKTLTLVHRVQKLLADGVDPAEIVVLSMTNRTVISFRRALSKLIGETAEKVKILTFHSFAGSMLEARAKDYFPDRHAQILVNDASFSGYVDLFLGAKRSRPKVLEKAILAVKSGGDLDEIAEKYKVEKSELVETIRRFRENGVLRYLDFISAAGELLDASQGEVVENVKVFIIDEFQDMQPELVKFVQKLVQYNGQHITLAGDCNQCIYEFLGSYPEITSEFIEKLQWDSEHIVLRESFRLTPENMRLSNSVIPGVQLVSTKESSAEPLVVDFHSHHEEFDFMGSEISRLILELGGLLKFSDFTILTRTNHEVDMIANYLSSEYGFDVNKFTLGNDWVNSKAHIFLDVLDVLSSTKGSDMAFLLILQKLGVQKSLLRRVYQEYEKWDASQKGRFEDYLRLPMADKLFNTERRRSSKSIIDNFLKVVGEERQDFTDPVTMMTSLARVTRETKLINYLNENKTHHPRDTALGLFDSIQNFYKCWRPSMGSYVEDEPRFDDNSVNISTIHKAKGLEFPVVFLAQSRMRYLETDEGRRLLYVAMTRAKNLLYCGLPGADVGEVAMPVNVNHVWLNSTARDLQRLIPTSRHLAAGQRILRAIRPI
ncbi:ATP-dependent DNA helicase HMI1, mitochondrial [Candida viswanathii]|uniref:DNA 3'-5' helicase n=1 Tax=Candida viswanathii TaxID=5486 RepID=A0A367YFT9_9ASCO|nr:ATP-dependent DNA helicase HMI1, mitochondrial [Candida viswanathii]